MRRKYKALIIDVDGTLVPIKKEGMPSEVVRQAINKANKLIHIGVATSRPLFLLNHIFDDLKLSGPSIINGGCQVVDINSKKIVWQKRIILKDIKTVYELGRKMNISFIINDNGEDIEYSKELRFKNPLSLWKPGLTNEFADNFISKTSHIPTITIHKIPSWQKNKVDILISHVSATKHKGVMEVAKLLNIDTHEIIGVGDGYNDFPLLMACGLKVAMGNAVKDLKEIADYVAPTVEEDGVAHIINKFILDKEKIY